MPHVTHYLQMLLKAPAHVTHYLQMLLKASAHAALQPDSHKVSTASGTLGLEAYELQHLQAQPALVPDKYAKQKLLVAVAGESDAEVRATSWL